MNRLQKKIIENAFLQKYFLDDYEKRFIIKVHRQLENEHFDLTKDQNSLLNKINDKLIKIGC